MRVMISVDTLREAKRNAFFLKDWNGLFDLLAPDVDVVVLVRGEGMMVTGSFGWNTSKRLTREMMRKSEKYKKVEHELFAKIGAATRTTGTHEKSGGAGRRRKSGNDKAGDGGMGKRL